VALDYPDSASAIKMAESLDPSYCRVKVGKELYTRCGPQILESLHGLGFEVFLDLKFHDIPNTTANAVAVAADLGVWMVNVHASGGRQMMEACVSKLTSYQKKPLLIAVTVLTSMQDADLHELGLEVSAQQQVNRLAELSR
ncbi:orotidine-5'-phosphate decarboxylase, partial [Oleiphilus sp. HI0123]